MKRKHNSYFIVFYLFAHTEELIGSQKFNNFLIKIY